MPVRCARWSPILILPTLAACGPGPAGNPNVFHYNQAEGITSLDPAFARNLENMWAVDQLFDGLVEMGPDLKVRPCLASNWQVSDDGRTYLFYLREAFFHPDDPDDPGPGRRVKAADFVFSFERLRDPKVASPGRWVFDQVLPAPEGFQVMDDSTLMIRLKAPFAPFLGILSMPYCAVIPREAVEGAGTEWRSLPVGTGPFRFAHWKEGVKLALRRNEHYWEHDDAGTQLPYLDGVTVSFVKDRNAEFMSLLKGDLDMMSGTEGGFLAELLDPLGQVNERYASRVHLERTPALATDYLGFLLDSSLPAARNSPWTDERLREAISLSIDRKNLVVHLLRGIGTPSTHMIPAALIDRPDDAAEPMFDPARARALLAEAGHPGGHGLPPLTITTTASYLELMEFVQHELERQGIKVKVNVVPLSTHKEGVANGDFTCFRKNWTADYPDAENFELLFFGPNAAPAGPNYCRYRNGVYDALYAKAMATPDPAGRLSIDQRLDSIATADMPAVVLFHTEVVRFVAADVTGLRAEPMNMLDLRRVRKGH